MNAILSADLVTRLGGGLPVVIDVDGQTLQSDTVALPPNEDPARFQQVLDVDGVPITIVPLQTPLLPDSQFDLIDEANIDEIRGTPLFNLPEGDWDVSTFTTNGTITFLSDAALLAGDYNGSGGVEQGDLDLVLLHWGDSASPLPDGWLSDLPSGANDQDELDAVLLNWGQTSLPPGLDALPEPSTAWLIFLAVAVWIVCAKWCVFCSPIYCCARRDRGCHA